jgi:hypothetical protein
MVHVVPAHFAAGRNVVLAAVDDIGVHAQLLHHGGAGAAQEQVEQLVLKLMLAECMDGNPLIF